MRCQKKLFQIQSNKNLSLSFEIFALIFTTITILENGPKKDTIFVKYRPRPRIRNANNETIIQILENLRFLFRFNVQQWANSFSYK